MENQDLHPLEPVVSRGARPRKSSPTVRDIAHKAEVSVGTVSRVLNKQPGLSEEIKDKVLKVAEEMGYDMKNLRANAERVGLSDISRLANVSLGSVSRALKGTPGVSDETRERVLRAAKDLGYDTSNLRQGAISRVGVFIHRGANALSHNDFYSPVLRGAEEACRQRKLSVTYSTVGAGDNIREIIEQQEVDGLLCIGFFEPEIVQIFRETGKPVVLVDHASDGIPSVTTDNFSGARQAVNHLIRMGRRRIGFISGPLEHQSIRERWLGYRQALYDARIPADPRLESTFTFDEHYGGRRAMRELLALKDRPDGVFAANDNSAMDATFVCKEASVSIPEEIAVVGFDDVVGSAYFNPPLTTVRVPKEELGAKGVEMLLSHRMRKTSQKVVVPVRLVVRSSAGESAGRGFSRF